MAFLSPAWLDELATVLHEANPTGPDERIALGQIVTETPHGAVHYTISLGGGEAPLVAVGTDAAQVVLVEDYATAVALATGRPAAELLSEGKVKIRGDASVLVRAQDAIAALGPALADLAATTSYA